MNTAPPGLVGQLQGRFTPLARALAAAARLRPAPLATLLVYHDVLPVALEPHHISVDAFRAQMERLAEGPFHVVSLADALERRHRQGAERRGAVVVTFDDARDNFVTNALPVLDEFRLPCTMFAPSGLLGAPHHMSAGELAGLAGRGIEIGAHSRSHLHLADQDDATVDAEVRGSKQDLEDLLGHPVRYFAYPYGSVDRRVQHATAAAGYDGAVLSEPGRITDATDRHLMYRSAPDSRMSLAWFDVMALGGDDVLRHRLLPRRPLKLLARAVVGGTGAQARSSTVR